MLVPRWHQAATLLADGRVLVTGGTGNSGALSEAEIYDPSTGHWTGTTSMNSNRWDHTATLMANGDVLVAGGYTGGNFTATAEIYHPASQTWTVTTNSMSAGRRLATATLLKDGRVLVAGANNNGSLLASADIYDPAVGAWSPTFGPMTSARGYDSAVRLVDGRVLVAGGDDDFTGINLSITAEIFDPQAGTTPAIVLVPSSTLVNGVFQFGLQATAGASFTVWASTNVTINGGGWISLGTMTETSPGQYQFSDGQAPNLAHRFYRVTSP
ncbi:MAG TPA: kelch repeat-containing protein, partial [Verrucomicrobiae bacterium]|nr:kelch repeat-containing protein [Verrucomicrobiae bacterium]